MSIEAPSCRPEPPTWPDRIKALIWAIVATVIGFLTTAWLGLQPWFWDLLTAIGTSV